MRVVMELDLEKADPDKVKKHIFFKSAVGIRRL